uniref:Acetylserotonin O-methyltransferase n=1 Tax=Chelonoidis abingdonii TaxID=106734 RepID=A0A8C0JC04_CHEAB
MSSTEDLDYPQILFQYNNGFLVSKIMFTACELGVFDLLLKSEGSLSSDAIAERLGTSISGMERLLDACVGLKLLEVEMKSEGAFYRNTELSNLYLTKSSPKSQYHNLMYYSKTVYLCWHYLTDAVRDGKNQYERAFGVSSKDLFGALYRSEEEMIQFMYGLNAIWSICGRDVIAAFDLSPFTVIYDLGGCAGGLAQECISLYPKSTVTIYDLPKVVQVAKERFVPPEERQITFHEGKLGLFCVCSYAKKTVLNGPCFMITECNENSHHPFLFTSLHVRSFPSLRRNCEALKCFQRIMCLLDV